MDMRSIITLAEGLFDFMKSDKKPAAPQGPRSMTAVMPSGHGIRWHKETEPTTRKLIWHGKFSEEQSKRVFKLEAELLSPRDEWRYSLSAEQWGYVEGVSAINAVKIALKGLLVMCEALRPASVAVSASGNLEKFFASSVKENLAQFQKLGYAIKDGRLVRVR